MTNEEMVVRIQAGETDLMAALWEQVQRYASKRAVSFFYRYRDRCVTAGVELDDIKQEAYLGVYAAAHQYKAAGEAKFITYMEYHLRGRFYAAIKYRGGQSETSLEDVLVENGTGAVVKLSDTLIDPHAETTIYGFIEFDYQKDYQARLKEAIAEALKCLLKSQKEMIIASYGQGISLADYAKQKGISRQAAHDTKTRVIKRLRRSSALTALWSESMKGVA